MEARVSLFEKGKDGLKPIFGLGAYLKKSRIEQPLVVLIEFRISTAMRKVPQGTSDFL